MKNKEYLAKTNEAIDDTLDQIKDLHPLFKLIVNVVKKPAFFALLAVILVTVLSFGSLQLNEVQFAAVIGFVLWLIEAAKEKGY